MFTWSRVVPCKYPNTSEVIWCGWRMGILEVITVWCLGFDWAAPGLQWGPGGEAGVRSSFAPRHRGRETNITPYLVKCHPETVRNCPLNENRERYFHRPEMLILNWHHENEWLVWPGLGCPEPTITIQRLLIPSSSNRNHSFMKTGVILDFRGKNHSNWLMCDLL